MSIPQLIEDASALEPYLPAAQIIIALLLVVLILLQPRGESLGSAFGQNFSLPGKLRGSSKTIFWITVSLAFAFIILALLNLLL
ncbi:MAG: preprotein translocase subunit SecG [bacterium]|nr:preprotein translocase subunit SecG [bacterium]